MGSLPQPADPGEVVSSPAQQTVQLILSLHRESQSVIQFLPLKPGGEVPPGWPKRIPASDLDTPGFADDLLAEPDTLMTINGLREGASNARAENVRYLNALWVDCDCHDLTRDEQEAQLQALESSGLLPPPSVVVWSGRGFWLLWKLTGGRETAPPTVDEGRGALHREIASEIVQAIETDFPELRPDKASTNVNRLTRVPGSINSKSGTPVRWEVRDPGKCYRLEEWPRTGARRRRSRATRTGARPAREAGTSSPIKPAVNAEPWDGRIPVAKNPHGKVMRWEVELRDFCKLSELRKGFSEGTRNIAAWLYAYMLRESWVEEDEILARVKRLASECQPPLNEDECRAAVRSSRSIRNSLTRQYIVTVLEVKPTEAEHLERWHDPETQLRLDNEAAKKEPRKRHPSEERHKAIMTIVKERGGEILPIRPMHKLLQAAGINVSKNTVTKDYYTLGLS